MLLQGLAIGMSGSAGQRGGLENSFWRSSKLDLFLDFCFKVRSILDGV